ncbi:MAG: hypothetical protein IKO11_03855 [Lachnospiraceae bacterium]|nr:hypothetical protein [Lachnospiraceae bacterium]
MKAKWRFAVYLLLFLLLPKLCVQATDEQEGEVQDEAAAVEDGTEDADNDDADGTEASGDEEELQEETLTEEEPEEEEPYVFEGEEGNTVLLGERRIPLKAVKLNLSGMNLNPYNMDELFSRMPNLKRVEMIGCGLSNDAYAQLQDNHPGIRMIWEIRYATRVLRTDAVGWSTFRGMHGPMDLPMSDADTKYLKYCRDLICVDLGHNYIRDISFVQYMPNLQIFIAVDNGGLWDLSVLKYCPKLRYIEIFVNRVSDLSVFRYLHQLEDVNISYNPIRSNEYLKDLPHLQKLWLEATLIPGDQVQELRSIYPGIPIVNVGSGSVDQGWRSGSHYIGMRDLIWKNVTNDVYH